MKDFCQSQTGPLLSICFQYSFWNLSGLAIKVDEEPQSVGASVSAKEGAKTMYFHDFWVISMLKPQSMPDSVLAHHIKGWQKNSSLTPVTVYFAHKS